jgi:hypothetical protein
MRPSLRFQSPLNEILPDLFIVCLVFARRKLAFCCHSGNAVAYSVASQARVNGKRDQRLTDPPLSGAEMNRARGGLRRETLLSVAS